MNMNDIQFSNKQKKPPESVCSLACERGQAKKYVEETKVENSICKIK